MTVLVGSGTTKIVLEWMRNIGKPENVGFVIYVLEALLGQVLGREKFVMLIRG